MARKARTTSTSSLPSRRLLLFNEPPTPKDLVRCSADIGSLLRPGGDRKHDGKVLRIRCGANETTAALRAVNDVFRKLGHILVSDSAPDSLKSLAGIWIEGSDIAELRKGISSMKDLSDAVFSHEVPYIGVQAGAELAGLQSSDESETLEVIDAHVRTGLPAVEGPIAESYRSLSGSTRKTVFALMPKSVVRLDPHGMDIETRVIEGSALIYRPGRCSSDGIQRPYTITANKGYRGFVQV